MPSRSNREQASTFSRTSIEQMSPPLCTNIEQTSMSSVVKKEKSPPPSRTNREHTSTSSVVKKEKSPPPSRTNREHTSTSSVVKKEKSPPPSHTNREHTSSSLIMKREKTPPPSRLYREQMSSSSSTSRVDSTTFLSCTERGQQTSTIPPTNRNVCDSFERCTEGNVSSEMDFVTARSSPRPSSGQMTNRDTSSALSTGRKKKPLSSKEIIHTLFDLWQPQLSASYRPHVRYVPTDFSQFRAFSEMSHASTNMFSFNYDNHKFRAAERVVETCNMLNGNSLSHRGSRPSSRRPSCVRI